jgi:hypothetical protein
MIPQSFVTGGNWSYPYLWAVTGDLWYPGYKSPSRLTEEIEKYCVLELFVTLCISSKLVGCVAVGLFFADAQCQAVKGIVEVATINDRGDIRWSTTPTPF